MMNIKKIVAFCVMIASAVLLPVLAQAQSNTPRLALVIGNAHYANATLATPANDAGLIAQTLQDQGFDVTAAADLNYEELRRAFQDFVAKAQKAGPQSVVFVYLAGRGVQYAGENFFVPVDATIARATDVPLVALRLSDYTQALAGLPAQ
ncbi:MAG TPA: caspase family protein, partial [Methylovirgula sp.]|nr:caspase family protein [Methylovirgula sp.]